jgi:hypothetical protein
MLSATLSPTPVEAPRSHANRQVITDVSKAAGCSLDPSASPTDPFLARCLRPWTLGRGSRPQGQQRCNPRFQQPFFLGPVKASRSHASRQVITDASEAVGCSLDPSTGSTDPFPARCLRPWTHAR